MKKKQMDKCATGGGRSQKLKLKKHALPAIEAVLTEVYQYLRNVSIVVNTKIRLRSK